MQRIWGLDLGTTSIGFAVLEHDAAHAQGQIVRLGVRVFPEGVEPIGGGSDKAPRNQQRRQKRLMRRQIRRRRLRRKLIGDILARVGLLPAYSPDPGSEWAKAMAADPYALRAKGLTAPLAPTELGRALYHVAKRRGFKSSRRGLEASAEDKEEGKVKEQIAELRGQMAGRTLGAFLAEKEKKRGDYFARDMVEAELDALWEQQQGFHPQILTEELRAELKAATFHQRPTFWRLNTLGRCRLEPLSPLCAKGSWQGQRYLLLTKLNILRLAGGNARELDPEERARVLALLDARPSVKFDAIRRALKALWEANGTPLDALFNLEVGGDKAMVGNACEAELAKVLGKGWGAHPARERIRAEFFTRLFDVHYRRIGNARIEIRPDAEVAAARAAFMARAVADWDVTREQAERLARIRLPAGWLSLSEAAVVALLPHLEAGLRYDQAMDTVYPGHRETATESLPRLPSHPRRQPELRNPTVHRALTELRKVVNNLLAVHGRPSLIRIELARELKQPKRKRAEIQKQQREQESRRKVAAERLKECGVANPSRDDVEKYLLWQESRELCPYTGRKLGFDDLFGAQPTVDVEHIFPFSRSLDNTFVNKTLCDIAFNRNIKKQRTPFECFRRPPEEWEEVRERVRGLDWSPAKQRRFLAEDFIEVDDAEFGERQLRDSSYIAVEARKFLERLDVPVEPCNGRITAQLRHFWGLGTLLGGEVKHRDDHRHHAIDALAVALTSRAHVKRLADAFARERRPEQAAFPPPWPTLRADAAEKLATLVVSHRALRKVSGPLHKETALGDTGEEVVEERVRYRLYVTRKSLDGITKGQIEDIRDPRIKEIVKAHVEARGGDPKKAFPPYPTLPASRTGQAREIRKVRILVRRQPELVARLRPGGEAWADADENHHMAVYRAEDGKVRFETVSRFEAMRRAARGEPLVKRDGGPGWRFVMSLAPGDMLAFPDGTDGFVYRRVTSVWSNGQVVLEHHTVANGVVWSRPNPTSLLKLDARKVKVDPIGRVRPARD